MKDNWKTLQILLKQIIKLYFVIWMFSGKGKRYFKHQLINSQSTHKTNHMCEREIILIC